MADINECLFTARTIKEGDFESWYDQWHALAIRVQAIAQRSLQQGHKASAYSAFLRASNYFRTSEFYLHGNTNDPRIRTAAASSRECFMQAIEFAPVKITPVKIPYEQTALPGYLFYSIDNQKRPTILLQTGFDGTQEEKYPYAIEAIKRGYNVLSFEGPGQGYALREQGLTFRADWEVVIQAVIDFAVKQDMIDANMLILYGLSFGGYFAPRGASGDDRIKILIANGGFYDLLSALSNAGGMTKDTLIQALQDENTFNQTIKEIMKVSTSIRWFYEHGMFSFGAKTPHELISKCTAFTLEHRAHRINATTLIIDSNNEMPIFQGQAQKIYDQLICPKTLMNFTSEEGAGFHCQIGALLLSMQRIFDWLDDAVAKLKSKH